MLEASLEVVRDTLIVLWDLTRRQYCDHRRNPIWNLLKIVKSTHEGSLMKREERVSESH